MFIDFDLMPDDSKIWVYQAERRLTPEEEERITEYLKDFTNHWTAHGKPLLASGKIMYGQFMILSVDQSQHIASGCSIDSSVGFIRKLEDEFNINFLDKTKIAFMVNDHIITEPFNNIKQKISDGAIKKENLTFNNAVTQKGELASNWVLPVEESWMKRFL